MIVIMGDAPPCHLLEGAVVTLTVFTKTVKMKRQAKVNVYQISINAEICNVAHTPSICNIPAYHGYHVDCNKIIYSLAMGE